MALEVLMNDYDPEWKKKFSDEKKKLRKALGKNIKDIQHVGSTSVKGLPAQDTLDILLLVRKRGEADGRKDKLAELGYAPENLDAFPACSRYVKREAGREPAQAVLYIYDEARQEDADRMLAIRDYLAVDAKAADTYRNLKWELAAAYGDQAEVYETGKKAFLEEIQGPADALGRNQRSVSLGMSIGMCIGAALGAACGAACGNTSIGMCLGISMGLCLGMLYGSQKKEKRVQQ